MMLEMRQVSVSHGAVQAVSELDLDVAGGEVVAVLGANGAGKTTTLRAATGLVPYTGTIRSDGADVAATVAAVLDDPASVGHQWDLVTGDIPVVLAVKQAAGTP